MNHKLDKERNWTVLFIGGASGTGKSTLAYELAHFYKVNVLEVDDINQALKAATQKDIFPAMHSGANWKDIGVEGNVKWLIDVSKEMIAGIKAIVERHIEDKLPVIIEGDFIYPEFTLSFGEPKIKSLYVHESDKNQLLQNFFEREGGDLQDYRADISIAYGNWLKETCEKLGIKFIESRPWNTLLDRAISCLQIT